MKLGVYIGSFNPVHMVHEGIVKELLDNKIVDKLIVIPACSSYHLKSGLESFKDRYNMLDLVFSDDVIISELEKDEYHYTYQNIEILKKNYPSDDLYLIIGADNLIELNTWKNYTYLLENCYFIVYGRNGIDTGEYINNSFTNYKNKFIIRKSIDEVSSTKIRKLIKEGESFINELDTKVYDYIKEHKLYGWGNENEY